MSRGGKRDGAGGKSKWNNGKTKTIRVPVVLAESLLEIASAIDRGDLSLSSIMPTSSTLFDSDTDSKVIDMAGISLRSVNGNLAVYLEDLARKGYDFSPESISTMIKGRLEKLRLDEAFDHGNYQKSRKRY